MISICFPVGQTTSCPSVSETVGEEESAKAHLVDTAGSGRFYHCESGLHMKKGQDSVHARPPLTHREAPVSCTP